MCVRVGVRASERACVRACLLAWCVRAYVRVCVFVCAATGVESRLQLLCINPTPNFGSSSTLTHPYNKLCCFIIIVEIRIAKFVYMILVFYIMICI